MSDFRFRKGAPGAGEPLPEFELMSTSGKSLGSQDLIRERPLLMVFGSVTCPILSTRTACRQQIPAPTRATVRPHHGNPRQPGPTLPTRVTEQTRNRYANAPNTTDTTSLF